MNDWKKQRVEARGVAAPIVIAADNEGALANYKRNRSLRSSAGQMHLNTHVANNNNQFFFVFCVCFQLSIAAWGLLLPLKYRLLEVLYGPNQGCDYDRVGYAPSNRKKIHVSTRGLTIKTFIGLLYWSACNILICVIWKYLKHPLLARMGRCEMCYRSQNKMFLLQVSSDPLSS